MAESNGEVNGEKKREKTGITNGVEEVENGKESPPERNKKGQFVNSPGPGRPPKEEDPPNLDGELLDAIEEVVRTGLGARELRDRLKAAGIALKVQSMRKPDSGPVLEPFVAYLFNFLQDFTAGYCGKSGTPSSPLEALNIIRDHMMNCPHSPSKVIEFEEVTVDNNL